MRFLRGPCCKLCIAALFFTRSLTSPLIAAGQHATTEQSSFDGARATTEPLARLAALKEFLQQFPSGSRSAAAQQLLLETYLASFPDETGAINALGHSMVMAVPAGFERWAEEARLANLLANTGETGVDLDQARLWAQDAVTSLTEKSYRHEMTAAQSRYKLPRIPQKQMHLQYTEYRASFLAAMAAIDLRQGKPEHASTLLIEASRLQPLSGEVNALQGQLALAQGDRPSALRSFERADALGALGQPWRARELQLFAELQHGDAKALDTQIDEVYRHLFPAPFTLSKRQLAPGGHTVLLELFTGSGCAPCAGPDLAIDSLLSSYSAQDLAVLAFDEHIPRPDPLARLIRSVGRQTTASEILRLRFSMGNRSRSLGPRGRTWKISLSASRTRLRARPLCPAVLP